MLLAIDQDAMRAEFVRVQYEVEEAARAIRESDLPDEFAVVLKSGGARLAAVVQ